VTPGDVVICHDPQTAGLVPGLIRMGTRVLWRCHIGHEQRGREVDAGWSFLRKYLEDVPLAVFSRDAYAPGWLPERRAVTLPPNIDPFSTKNQWMAEVSIHAVLCCADLVDATGEAHQAVFVRDDGSTGLVARRAKVIRESGPPHVDTPLIVQVSRWDRMKDHIGVLEGFARLAADAPHLAPALILAGPELGGVADDPEAPEVLADIERVWRSLPEPVRRRAHIAQLPMNDTDENAAMVNALQRHAAIIVQKSLREGFGLTVTEAMWKRRPVVASAVGGIKDQIDDGVEGLLVRDPTDAEETARALRRVLEDADLAGRLGEAAYQRVLEHYLILSSLEKWGALLTNLFAPEA
jgi:trehalose synthase